MNLSKILLPLVVTSAVAIIPFSTAFADGAAAYKEKCAACHGDDGNSTDGKVPSIASYSTASLEDFMEAYKSGERKGEKYKPKDGDETDMNEIAKSLKDDEAESIYEFIASQKFKPVKQDFDAKLAKKGAKKHKKKCEKCHSENGSNPDDDAGILAGQHREYLEEQFEEIAKKERKVSKKMWKKFKKLSEDDRKALIEFYISQQ